jgi:isopenicillin N synthase-like dioxygenase
MTAPYVPVVDLGAGSDGSLARVLRRAGETSGFAVVVGHGVADEVVADLQARAREMFSLPPGAKDRLRADPSDPLMRGYTADDTAVRDGTADDAGPVRMHEGDLVEAWVMSRFGEPDVAAMVRQTRDERLGMVNRWPPLTGFRVAVLAFHDAVVPVADRVMRLFALALDLPERWFEDKFGDHMSTLALNYYPAQPTAPRPGQLRKAAHRDWGTLTLLRPDGEPGLQVHEPGGGWLDVPSVPGSFVINIGDLMALWTNDRWSSTVHRVVNPPRTVAGRDRLSVALFHQPDPDASVECVPACAEPGTPPRHAPVAAWDYLLGRSRRAYIDQRLARLRG